MIGVINTSENKEMTVYESVLTDLNLSFLGNADTVRKLGSLLLCNKEDIVLRQNVFSDIMENDGLIAFFDELCKKLDALDELSSSRRDAAVYSGNEALLYSLRDLSVYTDCIESVIKAGEEFGGKIKSEGLKTLFENALEIKEKTWYKNALKFLEDTDEKVKDIKSISLGINLDSELRPYEAGIISFNTQPYVSNTVFDKLFFLFAKVNFFK